MQNKGFIMKILTLKYLVFISVFSASLTSLACNKVALWLETPSLGTQEESRELFKEIQNQLEETLVQKKYEVIPFGSYTRGLEDNVCEVNVLVSKKLFGKLIAEINIESVRSDISERLHSDKGPLKNVLKRIPHAQ